MWRKQEEPKTPSSPRDASGGFGSVAKMDSLPLAVPLASAPPSWISTSSAVAESPAAVTPSPAPTTGNVSATLVIKGEITGREDLFIDGDVQGNIRIEGGRVTIGSNGRVTADIEAREISVQGRVKGNLHGHERVQVGPTGCAHGNVVTRRIFIEDGAEVHGSIQITPAESLEPESHSPRGKSATLPAMAVEPTPVLGQESSTVA